MELMNRSFSDKIVLALGLAMLSACAQTTPKQTERQLPAGEVRNEVAEKRICTEEMTGVTNASLAGFFGKVVRNVEGPVTFCLELDATAGEDRVVGTLRVEYEDDFGIRFYQALEAHTFYGYLKENGTQLEMIFADNAGFIQIKGTATGEAPMVATIRYYNFPSFEQALDAAIQEAQTKCRSGAYTVTQCMGYSYQFPMSYWCSTPFPINPYTQILEQARALLASDKAKTFGQITFDLANVLVQ